MADVGAGSGNQPTYLLGTTGRSRRISYRTKGRELGRSARFTLYTREHGVEQALAQVRADWAEMLRREPPYPYNAKERRRHMGNVDEIPA